MHESLPEEIETYTSDNITTPQNGVVVSATEFLETLRPHASRNYKIASGFVAERHSVVSQNLAEEAENELVDKLIPTIENLTDPSRKPAQIESFSKSFLASCRFIGLLALRSNNPGLYLPEYLASQELRTGVMKQIGHDLIKMATLLSPQSTKGIAPTTWKAMQPHFMGPKDIRKILVGFPDLTPSLITKALLGRHESLGERLQQLSQTIKDLREEFPEATIGDINQAITRRSANPGSLLSIVLRRRKESPGIPVQEALRVSSEPRNINKLIKLLKDNPDFKELGIPNYVFRFAAKRSEPADYLKWFIEKREELALEFPECGKNVINQALTTYIGNPSGFCRQFLVNIDHLSNDPDYNFLSKKEKYSYAIAKPYTYKDFLKDKVHSYKAIMLEPRYVEIVGHFNIRNVIRNYENPEPKLRYMFLRLKFPKRPKWLIRQIVDETDNLDESLESIINFKNAPKPKPIAEDPSIENLTILEQIADRLRADKKFTNLPNDTVRRAVIEFGPDNGERILRHLAKKRK